MSTFEIYLIASGLMNKEDNVQGATLLHSLSPVVQRIFSMLRGEHKVYNNVKATLNGYFAPKWNIVAECYKQKSHAQRPDKPIDTYLITLRDLLQSCDFGTLEEEMICT